MLVDNEPSTTKTCSKPTSHIFPTKYETLTDILVGVSSLFLKEIKEESKWLVQDRKVGNGTTESP